MIPEVIATNGALMFRAGMVIDGDGAPDCYAPTNDPGAIAFRAALGLPPFAPLDYLANAMDGERYVGVVTLGGKPVKQGPNDPCPGYLVSPTSLFDRSNLNVADPRRYVNASAVPYIALCPEMRARGAILGDVAMVLYHGRRVGCVFADVSPHNHYGEASPAAARPLGIPPSPKNGGVSSGVTYVVFPGSTCGWPRTVDSITAQAERLFAAMGGANAVPWLATVA